MGQGPLRVNSFPALSGLSPISKITVYFYSILKSPLLMWEDGQIAMK